MEKYVVCAVGGPDRSSDNLETAAREDVEAIDRASAAFPDHGTIEVWCGIGL